MWNNHSLNENKDKLSHSCNIVEVAVPVPVFNTFSYRYPERYSKRLEIGMRVLVPFGRRQLTGFIVGFPETEPQNQIELKEIYDLLDDEPLFGEDDLAFYRWTSNYYYYPIGQTIKTALPRGLNPEYIYAASITEQGCSMLRKKSLKLSGLHVLYGLAEGKEVLLKDLERKVGRKDFNFNINILKRKTANKGFL